jgi:hypothetical protein
VPLFSEEKNILGTAGSEAVLKIIFSSCLFSLHVCRLFPPASSPSWKKSVRKTTDKMDYVRKWDDSQHAELALFISA